MPEGQIAKCAEALALRRAFPEDLSGIYITEEMDQVADTVIADAQWEEVEETTPEAKPALDLKCSACGHKLMRSQFPDKVTGEVGWYCNKKRGGCGKSFSNEQLAAKPEPKVEVKPDTRVKVAEVQPQKPKTAAPKAEPKPNPAPVPTADGPISDGQVRLLKTLFAQTALVEGEDWNAAIAHLTSMLEGEAFLSDDLSSMANFEAILRTVPKSKLNGLLKTAQAMKAEKAERKEEQNNAETDN